MHIGVAECHHPMSAPCWTMYPCRPSPAANPTVRKGCGTALLLLLCRAFEAVSLLFVSVSVAQHVKVEAMQLLNVACPSLPSCGLNTERGVLDDLPLVAAVHTLEAALCYWCLWLSFHCNILAHAPRMESGCHLDAPTYPFGVTPL